VDQATLHWLPTEGIAQSLFGDQWSEYVVDITEETLQRLPLGRDMTASDSVDTSVLKTRRELTQP
jgi:hypothetical protein